MSKLTRNGTAEPVSPDQTLSRGRGQENIHFPFSADHEQDWQPYPVVTYSSHMLWPYKVGAIKDLEVKTEAKRSREKAAASRVEGLQEDLQHRELKVYCP